MIHSSTQRHVFLVIGIILLCSGGAVRATVQEVEKDHRILIILDGSVTMMESVGSDTRFSLAEQIITNLVDSLYKKNQEVAFGLRLFGQQYDESRNVCNDSRREVNFSKDNLGQVSLRLKDLKPKGKGAVAFAIGEALRQDMPDTALYHYSIVLVRTASSSCNDDVCHAFANSNNIKLYRKFLINIPASSGSSNQCFDKVFDITGPSEIPAAVEYIVTQYPRRRRVVVGRYGSGNRVRKEDEYIPAKPAAAAKTLKAPPVVAVPPADTIPPPPPKESKVDIRKGSRITMEEPETFGVLLLVNTDLVGNINIYKAMGGGNYKLVQALYPVGLDQAHVKLEPGEYKMTYSMGMNSNIARYFDIKEQKVTEIWFR